MPESNLATSSPAPWGSRLRFSGGLMATAALVVLLWVGLERPWQLVLVGALLLGGGGQVIAGFWLDREG